MNTSESTRLSRKRYFAKTLPPQARKKVSQEFSARVHRISLPMGPDRLKQKYSDPHWQMPQGSASPGTPGEP